jgi:riboflavin synthase
MFTGLVERTGMVTSLAGGRLVIDVQPPLAIEKGGSVAVNGVCLTATGDGGSLETDVMDETLRRTALGALTEGARVNLELPLRLGDPVGGHIVQGHVDGVGTVDSLADEGFARVVHVAADAGVLRYVVEKGSIAVDGVSLTVAGVDERSFSVSLIPETLETTTLGGVEPGRKVNLEVDVLAKYVEKLAPTSVVGG